MDSFGPAPTGPLPELDDLSDDDVERLVQGTGGPSAWFEVAELLDRIRMEAAVEPDDLWVRTHVAVAAAAARNAHVAPDPTAGRVSRPLRAGAVAAATTTLLATVGFAAADTLPPPLQSVASQVASLIGVTVPGGHPRPGEPAGPTTAPGQAPALPAVPGTTPAGAPADGRDRDARPGLDPREERSHRHDDPGPRPGGRRIGDRFSRRFPSGPRGHTDYLDDLRRSGDRDRDGYRRPSAGSPDRPAPTIRWGEVPWSVIERYVGPAAPRVTEPPVPAPPAPADEPELGAFGEDERDGWSYDRFRSRRRPGSGAPGSGGGDVDDRSASPLPRRPRPTTTTTGGPDRSGPRQQANQGSPAGNEFLPFGTGPFGR